MDYEKKIRDYMNSSEVDQLYKSLLSNLFPELVEPKEEKARRSLLEFLEDLFKLGKYINFDRWSKADCEEWVNWVMKQGEQKPVPDWMPKFLDELRSKKNYFDWDEHKDIEGGILAIINWMNPNYFNEKDGKQKPTNDIERKYNPCYNMSFEEAQEYISNRGFDIPWTDCDVFVDFKYVTQTVANILRWADDNPKQKSTTLELKAGCWYLCIEDYQPRADYTDFYQGEKYHCEKDGVMGKWCIKHPEKYFRECKKPDDRVEPKFHEGDWVVVDGVTQQVTQIRPDGFDTNRAWNGKLTFNDVHLWTIQDAKDGDVLCTYECGKPKIVFILKGAPKKPYALGYHCYYNIMYPHFEFDSEKGCLAPNEEDVKPATKEQRDTLMKAMADAGYTFDFEKKELKKVEQKPAEVRTTGYWHVEDIEQKPAETEKGAKGNDREIPNSTWSEEDKKLINDTCHLINTLASGYGEKVTEPITLSGTQMIASIKDRLRALVDNRPQNTWKPSEEMLEALYRVIPKNVMEKSEDEMLLDKLYQGLKYGRVLSNK